MFQAALGGAILFNPERHTDPIAIAAGFAVLLLPYSIVGPFAGALIDRWDRRLVLLWANLLRAMLIVATATLLLTGAPDTSLFVLALATVGVSRFVLAGVSASLPKVVRPSWLVPTNSVLVTSGTVIAALGAGSAVAVIGLVGAGDRGSGFAVLAAVLGSFVSAYAAAGFALRQLGPTSDEESARSTVRAVLAGLKTGANAVWKSRGVTTAMIGIGAHRIVFGINTLVMILVLRVDDPHGHLPAGFAGFGVAVAAAAAGMLIAAIATPFVIPRVGRSRTIIGGLILAVLVQLTLVPFLNHAVLLASALLLGFAGQCIKLSGDAAMQIEIDDARRGQVFALQDTVFNLAFLSSIAASASVIAPSGHSPGLVFFGAGCYALSLVAIGLVALRFR